MADLHAIGATLECAGWLVCRRWASWPTKRVRRWATEAPRVAPVTLCQRGAHVYSFTRGQTAMERDPAGKAAAELAALHRWTVNYHGGNE